ncbi:MAG: recombinase family protein [Acutalibacteraceae bacterium]
MELRRILYGYRKEQFEFYVVPEEAVIVRRIFNEYIGGRTLKDIAEILTKEQIVYYKYKTEWTKNAVCRILENEHYMGDAEYPKIIDADTYKTAQKIRLKKGGKREKDSEEIIYFKNNLFCEVCGNRLTRRSKYTTHERWVCAKGCHKLYEYLDDETLIRKIQSILCFVKDNPSFLMMKTAAKPYTPTREVILKEKQVKNMIFEPKPLFQPIKALLYSSVNDKYNAMDFDTSKRFTNALCEYVASYNGEFEQLDIDFMKTAVSRLIIEADGKMKIRFANGKEISESEVTQNE